MTVERSKRRCFLTLTFIVKSVTNYLQELWPQEKPDFPDKLDCYVH